MAHVTADEKEKLVARIRRIQGQLNAAEKAIEEEGDCASILHTVSACRGAIESLMVELIEDHIRHHMIDSPRSPAARAKAAEQLIGIVKSYLK